MMKIVDKSKVKKEKRQSKGIGKAILTSMALILTFLVSLGIVGSFASPKRLDSTEEISQIFTVIDSSGGTYFGPVTDMAYSGVGEFQYLDGGMYEGSFSDSRRSGEGTFTWDNGDCYTGSWEQDKMLTGTYAFANGSKFTGTFQNNSFLDGTFDLGSIAQGHGLTSFTATYENGEVKSIKYKSTDGMSYDGELTGTAKITYQNGDNYSGSVKDGVRNGSGIYSWIGNDGKISAKYDGNWSNGVMQGTGKYHYTSAIYPYIKGTFDNGKPNGTAIYYKEAGNTFDTTWANGRCSKVKET